MQKENQKISVIIPAYNRADLLPRTVGSIVAQTYPVHEIIIVDDESPDHTAEVCADLQKSYPDMDISYLKHETNKGEGGARNTGLKAATGDLLAFLDSDDEWLPEKLERQVAFLEETNAGGVFCETFQVTDGDYESARPVRIHHDQIVPEHLMTRGCGYGVGTNLLIRRDILAPEDIFDESLRLFIDLDWLYRVAQKSSIRILHERLTYYHKAPMRAGDYIEMRVGFFLEKYKDHLQTWPLWKRYKVYACMHWYIAHAYKGCGHHFKAAKHFAIGILQSPLRNPGQYTEPFRSLFMGMFCRKEAA